MAILSVTTQKNKIYEVCCQHFYYLRTPILSNNKNYQGYSDLIEEFLTKLPQLLKKTPEENWKNVTLLSFIKSKNISPQKFINFMECAGLPIGMVNGEEDIHYPNRKKASLFVCKAQFLKNKPIKKSQDVFNKQMLGYVNLKSKLFNLQEKHNFLILSSEVTPSTNKFLKKLDIACSKIHKKLEEKPFTHFKMITHERSDHKTCAGFFANSSNFVCMNMSFYNKRNLTAVLAHEYFHWLDAQIGKIAKSEHYFYSHSKKNKGVFPRMDDLIKHFKFEYLNKTKKVSYLSISKKVDSWLPADIPRPLFAKNGEMGARAFAEWLIYPAKDKLMDGSETSSVHKEAQKDFAKLFKEVVPEIKTVLKMKLI